MKTIRIGVLGASRIAGIMAQTVNALEHVELSAVAARELRRGEEFAAKNGVPKAYGSYEELAKDETLDLIYITSPQSFHYPHMKLCLENGKNVFCEKAFTLNAAQAREVISLAEEKGLFLCEAMWTRFTPFAQTVKELLKDGIIGTPKTILSNNGFDMRGTERIDRSELGGGALLDVGVYALTAVAMLFEGEIAEISSQGVLTEEGVDAHSSTVLRYADGRLATVNTSMDYTLDPRVTVYGDKGYLVIDNTCNWERAHLYSPKGELLKIYERPMQITGYEYEVLACCEALRAGKRECSQMPHGETLRLMEQMDEMRRQWGMRFSFAE